MRICALLSYVLDKHYSYMYLPIHIKIRFKWGNSYSVGTCAEIAWKKNLNKN